jgi:hypothetical protein
MPSILDTVYTTLQAMSVSYKNKSGATVTPAKVYGLTDFPASIQTAHLSCRILFPPSIMTSPASGAVLDGSGVRMTWNIADWFLLTTAAQDMGPSVEFPVLSSYMQSYAKNLAISYYRITANGAKQTATMSFSMNAGIYPFPPQSDAGFWMVQNTIVIEELI